MAPQLVFGGGRERLDAVVALQTEVFLTDPVLRYLLHSLSPETHEPVLRQLITTLQRSAALNGAVFDEAWTVEQTGDKQPPQSSMTWLAPGRRIESWRTWWPSGLVGVSMKMGLQSLRRMLSVVLWTDRAKKRALADRPYYYLFWVGTDASARGTGLGSLLIQNLLDKAGKEKLPVYLEASSEASRRLYLRLGFKDTETCVLGANQVDAKGDRSKGGPGVKLFGMVWQPEQSQD